MEKLRSAVIELVEKARISGNESELLAESMRLILAELKGISGGENYEVRNKIAKLTSQFCGFFVACLAVLRSGQQIERITRTEQSFQAKNSEIQIHFLKHVLEPLCLQANKTAIEIAAYFLLTIHDQVTTCARKVLAKAGRKSESKSLVTETLLSYVPSETGALSILAEVDAETAAATALGVIKQTDKQIRHEALDVLAKTALSQGTADQLVEYLKKSQAKAIWKDSDDRRTVYALISKAYTSGVLSEDDAKVLLAKSFQYEWSNRGLGSLLPVVSVVCPKDEELMLFNGFLAMETQNKANFLTREESVKEYVATLQGTRRIEYLRKTLLVSTDQKFAWFAGQQLIATDVPAAAETFVECAKDENKPTEFVGSLAQLAMKVCNSEKDSVNWSLGALNKPPKSRFAPVAQALLDYAESAACPTKVRLAIAFQPGMFGGNTECCRRANTILEMVILDKEASSAQVLKALQALLNCRLKKETLASDVDAVLKRAYTSATSAYKERFLDQLLEIMTKDIRGYPMEPLFPPIVNFLTSIKPAEAIPILEKALQAALPNADLGLSARASYIFGLKHFALKGSVKAVTAIAGYYGGNIDSGVIPATLAAIYQAASSVQVKEAIAKGVAARFLYSITKETATRVFYHYELKAVEALKEEPLVQAAFLKGISEIGNIASKRSVGMGGIIKKIPTIIPKEKKSAVQETLNHLIEKLATERQQWIASLRYHRIERDDYVWTIDTICAEAGLVMTGM